MTNVPPLEATSAPKEVAELYHDFQRRMGFPAAPNFITTQGHSLAAARGTWGLVQNVLLGGILPRSIKEMMFAAISRVRDCQYCTAAHLARCRMLGVDAANIDSLVSNLDDVTPVKVREIIRFGLKSAKNPQSLESEDFERLRNHGLSQSEIVEVTAMSALAVYATTIADATGMRADEMFSEV